LRGWRYLAPYIFRVAISNQRILKLENGQVTFRYRATDTGRLSTCTLPALEFIRRFLQHVLPKGFVKVRYYGFLAIRSSSTVEGIAPTTGRPGRPRERRSQANTRPGVGG